MLSSKVPAATLALSFLCCVSALCQAQQGDDQNAIAAHKQRLESGLIVTGANGTTSQESLSDRMAFYHVPGVSIAVINNEKIEWAQGYGVLEAGKDAPVTDETRFQAASISKFVSSVGLLSLVQAGKLDLDTDVNQKLTSWQVHDNRFTATQKVTLRRLLSHEAGLGVHGFGGYEVGHPIPTLVEVLRGSPPANSAPVQVVNVPGSQFLYSGGGYCVVQQLAMDVTGQSYPDFMQSAVLGKANMAHSSFEQPMRPEWEALAASGHDAQGQVIAGKWHIYPEMAAAGLWTTPSDLAHLAIEIEQSAYGRSNKILSQSACQAMLTRQKGYGLGVDLALHRFSHTGVNAGFRCSLVCLDSGKGVVIMTNADNGAGLDLEIVRTISQDYAWNG